MSISGKLLAAGVVFTGLAIAGAWLFASGNARSVSFQTASIERGDIEVTISATGTVEPEEVIDVGAQVAGKITAFGNDASEGGIDYGSAVEEGTVLARIDDSLFASDVAQARAQLEQAKGSLSRCEADLERLKAKLFQAERGWERAKKLGPSRALSESDYEAYQSSFETARADVAAGKATIVQAVGAVAHAEATLQRTQQNLDYCTIKSPVKGVIIDRRVNIGQTVVASLSAPSLFLIAKDLRRMQVWVNVNEADIGGILPGQPVTFTVDAHPDRTFQGEVKKVRLNASMTQNVVTYTVEVSVDNSDLKLLPYLTANVKFLIDRRQNVLIAPSAAFRYTPRPERIAAKHHAGSNAGETSAVLWAPRDGLVQPVRVETGLSDGTMIEVLPGKCTEGTLVVVGEEQAESSGASQGGSPFTPRFFSGGKGGGHGH